MNFNLNKDKERWNSYKKTNRGQTTREVDIILTTNEGLQAINEPTHLLNDGFWYKGFFVQVGQDLNSKLWVAFAKNPLNLKHTYETLPCQEEREAGHNILQLIDAYRNTYAN
jgi:hypothetical protein